MKKLVFFIIVIFCARYGHAQTYNYFFGNLHSHSDYSDGNQDRATSGLTMPWQNFNFAKQSYHMDFLGISEHNHSATGMVLANYARGLTQADTTTTSSFVSLYGMEWGVTTNTPDGHVLIYGINQLIGWEAGNYDIFCARSDYNSLWGIIASYPNAFATLAHPQIGQFTNLDGAAYNQLADSVIVGTVVRSGPAFSTTVNYSDNPPTSNSYEAYYRKMLSKGYKLGPAIDHDNHNTTFGRTTETRTVVLATSLTRNNIIDAYKNRRFYASDDWNVQVNFSLNGNPMGSSFNTFTSSSITVAVNDPDNTDSTAAIVVFYGVPGSNVNAIVLDSVNNSNNFILTHSPLVGEKFYYYAKIRQKDGDIIWTSPIWINRLSSILPITDVQITAAYLNEKVQLSWQLPVSGIPVYQFEIEKSWGDGQFFAIGSVSFENGRYNYLFNDNNSVPGFQYYRIKIIDRQGNYAYSNIANINVPFTRVKLVSLSPNPAKEYSILHLQSALETTATIKLYSVNGALLEVTRHNLQKGLNTIQIPLTHKPTGMLPLVIEINNQRMIEAKISHL